MICQWLSSTVILPIFIFTSYVFATRLADSVPVIPEDFPDPSITKVGDTWYAFGTSHGSINVQMATSLDFGTWTLSGIDALPTPGPWVDTSIRSLWSPDVIQLDDGSYVLYYSARPLSNNARHCIGVATSRKIEGPYTSTDLPLACPLDQGGAIDSSGFRDVDGTRYVVYKIDGNAIGHGGTCGNTVDPIVPTPIMLQRLEADAITPTGAATQILTNDAIDGPLVEAPSLVRTASGEYVLFFSSNCWHTPYYDVTYATAPSVSGPYTKYGPLFTTGVNGLTAPGGASIDADGHHMVFHANTAGGRGMFTALISINGNVVTA